METIVCPLCYERILILPDPRAMDKAIDNHVEKRRRGHAGIPKGVLADVLAQIVIGALTIDPWR